MRRFNSMNGFLKHLGEVEAEVASLTEDLAHLAAPLLADNVKDVMGDLALLEPLAKSTQDERVRLEFTPNDPLVRSGELRSTVEFAAAGPLAIAGSDDPRAKWLNDGTPSIPARPHFGIGLGFTVEQMEPVIGKIVSKIIS